MVESSLHLVITGANGLVGSSLLEALVNHFPQSTIKALVRRLPNQPHPGVDYVLGDLTQTIPPTLFSQNSYLFHFAHQHTARDLESLRLTNVQGLEKLLKAGEGKIKKIFLGSSMSVYGQGPFQQVPESAPTAPQTNLAHTRVEAEESVKRFCQQAQIPYFIFRPRFLFDPREKETLPKLYAQFSKGVMLGSGEQRFSFILVEDYVKIILQSVALNQSQVLNVAYVTTVSLKEIYALFGPFKQKRRIPAGLLIPLLKFFRLRSLATKLELVGLDQTLDTTQLLRVYPDIRTIDGVQKLSTLAHSITRGHP
ncbi:MAG: NAD-dependent epimerase/dehydratase family protein [Proteobacteria bacterium]|jgi:nucleoside-diphosphate-sugar epimerase|nr:NAD-dependent epimerase/dehydratase family protein [Pseudomonadota bacterium]